MPRAIVIVTESGKKSGANALPLLSAREVSSTLSTVEILGQSIVQRVTNELARGGMDRIALFDVPDSERWTADEFACVSVFATEKIRTGVLRELLDCKQANAGPMLILFVGQYCEFDLIEYFQFHLTGSNGVTRGVDGQGEVLDYWLVDPSLFFEGTEWWTIVHKSTPAYYSFRGYVNRLQSAQDLRRLVVDCLEGRCRLKPQGSEIRPGVWFGDRVEVARGARLVAPVFIGSDVVISDQCLITRASNVERYSHIDYGSVVESSSILPNSYVGIGLDLSHSIVDGSKLLSLDRGVLLEIEDAAVLRDNKPLERTVRHSWNGFVSSNASNESKATA